MTGIWLESCLRCASSPGANSTLISYPLSFFLSGILIWSVFLPWLLNIYISAFKYCLYMALICYLTHAHSETGTDSESNRLSSQQLHCCYVHNRTRGEGKRKADREECHIDIRRGRQIICHQSVLQWGEAWNFGDFSSQAILRCSTGSR